jgi:hypothetical protein
VLRDVLGDELGQRRHGLSTDGRNVAASEGFHMV